MNIKVRGGTPNHSTTSLCRTCRCAQVVRGDGIDESIVLCHHRGMEPLRVTFRVTQCSDFEDRSLPPLWELEKIAWRITADKNNVIGFGGQKPEILSPKRFKEKYPDED